MSTRHKSVKPGITADGFRTAVRDYTEPTVVEELAANSYDADASTALVLLDTDRGCLHIFDDGAGFTREAIDTVVTLGAGNKKDAYSKGKRHYLGSYGYGLQSSLNIATKYSIRTVSDSGEFEVAIDWNKLDEALKPGFEGYTVNECRKGKGMVNGTHICLTLKNPTSKDDLERYGEVLGNLPTDEGRFQCYYGMYSDVLPRDRKAIEQFADLRKIATRLTRSNKLWLAGSTTNADLEQCELLEFTDKIDKKVSARIYFAGMEGDKVCSLKRGLRGIYVRIHGRLLKQSFTDRRFTYNISKWVKFENGLRIELSVDWLRDQISLSREGVRFSNPKLEEEFKAILNRLVSRFILPQLKKLDTKKGRAVSRKHSQRIELAQRRVAGKPDTRLQGATNGFPYRPETDGELALIVAQSQIVKKVNPNFTLIDYNDQAPFDCLIYDRSRRSFVNVELEPTLPDFLDHKDVKDVEMVVTWTLGKWRVGAVKRGRHAFYKVVTAPGKSGNYRLLEYSGPKSRNPRRDLHVVALEEVLADA